LFVGITENMSRSGILVLWKADHVISSLPKPGDMLTVEVELPASQSFGNRCMQCHGVVTRIADGEQARGPRVALQVSQMKFQSYPNGRRASQNELRYSLM
jgi:hypothetical protein